VNRTPVIIIGMHRSGTSMITRLLEAMGLFVGSQKHPISHEALFFVRSNEWLLRQSGGSWHDPGPIHRMLKNHAVRALAVDYLRCLLNSWQVYSFMGLGKYLRYRRLENMPFPWGWKDPRSTYTLPLWLEVFPDAKIIHMRRHGVDVANSLKIRQEKALHKFRRSVFKCQFRRFLNPFAPSVLGLFHCRTLKDFLSLWDKYVWEADAHVRELKDRAMNLGYEDFLSDPPRHMEQLALFCGLKVTGRELERLCAQVDKERAYAYRTSPELRSFADTMTHSLKAHGYQ
jgi:hypothetical protein